MQKKGKLNERYYALNNVPRSGAFTEDYQFYDNAGRLYRLAEKNGRLFQTRRFEPHTEKQRRDEARRTRVRLPVVNNFGQVELFVKRPHSETPWFGSRDIGRVIVLWDAETGDAVAQVKLRYYEKARERARVGTVRVTGLDRAYCQWRLNRDAEALVREEPQGLGLDMDDEAGPQAGFI